MIATKPHSAPAEPSPASIQIVTRADDIGSFRSANRAALEACRTGLVRNVSMLVVGEHFEEAAEMFAGEKQVALGLHACITCEWSSVRWRPLLPPEQVPSIVGPDGALMKNANEIQDRGVRLDQILAELRAQLDRARKHHLEIAYLDDHMSIPWLFEESETYRLGDALAEWAEREGLIWAGWGTSLGLQRLEFSGENEISALAAAVRTAQPGRYVLVGHPAYDDEEMRESCMFGAPRGESARSRDRQRRQFTAPSILEAFARAGAVPIRYTDL